jgi:hypothetical protein
MAMAETNLKIKTERVQVLIFTEDFEIEGNAHVKPGGYNGRVIDILNQSRSSFIPITEARFRRRTGSSPKLITSDCLIVQIEKIEVISILSESE